MRNPDNYLEKIQEAKEQLNMLVSVLRPPGAQVQMYAADFKETNPKFAAELESWHREFSSSLDKLKMIVTDK